MLYVYAVACEIGQGRPVGSLYIITPTPTHSLDICHSLKQFRVTHVSQDGIVLCNYSPKIAHC